MLSKTFRQVATGAVAMMLLASPIHLVAAEKFPSYWRKTMTNNPATNVYLDKFTQSLGNSDADLLRNVMLSLLLGHACEASRVDKAAGTRYLKGAGYFQLKGKAWDDAAFLANDSFKYADYRTVAHLCAGIDYIFGKNGKLVQDLVSTGTGEPKLPYDPANPYIRVPPLSKP